MSASSAPAPVVGNVYDKYGSANPLVRRLMGGFLRSLDALVARAVPQDLLDVGCGEGVVTARMAARLRPGARVVGLDRDTPALRAAWGAHDGIDFVPGDACALPFGDGEFDVVSLVEMLQLVDHPHRAVSEAARVARRFVLVSVPREPIWRVLNVARGAYVRDAGNTPGHVHHWSRRGLVRLLAPHGDLVAVRTPLPWTLALISTR